VVVPVGGLASAAAVTNIETARALGSTGFIASFVGTLFNRHGGISMSIVETREGSKRERGRTRDSKTQVFIRDLRIEIPESATEISSGVISPNVLNDKNEI
jgi:hypothetical protein